MGLDKSGNVIYRCKHSRCKYCKYYIESYKCWFEDYIDVYKWNGSSVKGCENHESTLTKVKHNEFVFRDYVSMPDPERGRFRFDNKGNKI